MRFFLPNFILNYNKIIGLAFTSFILSSFCIQDAAAQYYKSFASGNWNAPGTWEVSSTVDGVYTPATVSPTNTNSSQITITSGHIVTVTANVTIDQTVISEVGEVLINPGTTLTIGTGVGDELTARGSLTNNGTFAFSTSLGTRTALFYGIFNNSGSITGATTARLRFEANSIYNHNFLTNPGTIPRATWNVASTVSINSYTVNDIRPAGLAGQAFGNFIWNTPALESASGYIDLEGALTTILGNFTVLNTNDIPLYLGGAVAFDMQVSGNFIIDGGVVVVNNSGTGTTVINITKDLILSSGSLDLTDGPESATINLTGNYNQSVGELRKTGEGNGLLNFNGASVTFFSTQDLADAIDYNVAENSVLDLGTSALTGSGKFNLSSGATLIVGSTETAGAIQSGITGGNIRVPRANRTFAEGARIVYRAAGAAPQYIGNAFPANADLEINNTNGVNLNSNLVIGTNRILKLNKSNLIINSYTLTLNGLLDNSEGAFTTSNTSNINLASSGPVNLSFSPVSTNLNSLNINQEDVVTLLSNITINGALTLTNGNFIINDRTLTLSGTASRNLGTLSGNTASVVNLRGSGDLDNLYFVDGGNSISSLTINKTDGSASLSNSLTINNSLNLTAGSLTTAGLTMADNALLTRTSGSISAAPTASGSYNVSYLGNIVPGLELPSSATSLKNLTINALGSSISLNKPITVNGDLNINSSTLNSVDNNISLKGNFTNTSGRFNPGTGTIAFIGTAQQIISSTNLLTFNDIIINNVAGVNLLDRNISLENKLTFTAGSLITNSNSLLLANNATIVGEASGKYVVGNLSTTRDLSASGSDFGGIGITIGLGPLGSQNLGPTVINRISGPNSSVKVGDDFQGINRRWVVEPTTQPTAPIDVTLSWVADDDNGKDLTTARVWKTEGDDTETYYDVSKINQNVINDHTITVTVSSFSIFTVSDQNNPLPVELVSFNVTRKSSSALLTWQTATEKNNQGFAVEVSEDARVFKEVGFLKSENPNSGVVQSYEFTHRAIKAGTFYYRIKQTDWNGATRYYGPKAVTFDQVIPALAVYPNPLTNNTSALSIIVGSNLPEKADITVTDILGKVVYRQSLLIDPAQNEIKVNLSSQAAGVYLIQVVSPSTGSNQSRIIKQ